MPPTVPLNHYHCPRANRSDRGPLPLFHANISKRLPWTLFSRAGESATSHGHAKDAPIIILAFLTASNLIYAIGAGITAAAGTRLALQSLLDGCFKPPSFQLQTVKRPASLFSVTTSLRQDWVICAPAAFLGCGSHFSGSLSGIEPLIPRYPEMPW